MACVPPLYELECPFLEALDFHLCQIAVVSTWFRDGRDVDGVLCRGTFTPCSAVLGRARHLPPLPSTAPATLGCIKVPPTLLRTHLERARLDYTFVFNQQTQVECQQEETCRVGRSDRQRAWSPQPTGQRAQGLSGAWQGSNGPWGRKCVTLPRGGRYGPDGFCRVRGSVSCPALGAGVAGKGNMTPAAVGCSEGPGCSVG